MAPRGREKNVTGSAEVGKAGKKVEGGPVGNASYEGRPGGSQSRPQSRPQGEFKGSVNTNQASYADRGLVGGSGGTSIILALLAWLFLGKKMNSGSASASAGGTGGSGTATRGLSIGKIVRIAIIAIIVILIIKSCSASSQTSYYTVDTGNSTNITSSASSSAVSSATTETTATTAATTTTATTGSTASTYNGYDLGSLLGYGVNSGSSSSGWKYGDNRKALNTSVASGARSKFYTPKSGDKVNIMIYMIGTDLESQSGMATSDLQEMCKATISDDVRVFVYGGGCTKWHNNAFSNSTNKLYQLKSGGNLTLLAEDGDRVMTDPNTLASFISAIGKSYDAANSRNILILWDHGGGSLTGYGYDQRHSRSSSMSLTGIEKALQAGGVKFDIIGFDACLMATTENALMCSDYGDYLVASEESEPGIGWYYTNWLTSLSNNTAMPSTELGKIICDDFVTVCGRQCSGQSATLSVVDLAEVAATIPAQLSRFSTATTDLIESNSYKTVANARAGAKEFAAGNGIDQVDLINFCLNLGTDEGKNLASALLGAVKYNNTSNDMANSYGLSVYFPYSRTSYVSTAVQTYTGIDLSPEYSKCIQAFAKYAGAGQYSSYGSSYGSSSGTSVWDLINSYSGSGYGSSYGSSYGGSSYGSSYGSNYGSGYGYSPSSSSYSSYGDIYSILEQMMASGNYGRSLTNLESTAKYIEENQIDNSALVFDDEGLLKLDDEQWSLITEVMLNVFYDTGDDIVDLGMDYTDDCLTTDGALVGRYDGTWTAINGIPVAYYHMNTFDDGTDSWQIMGYVPCLINGEKAKLILTFNEEHPTGYVSGAVFGASGDDVGTFAKSMTEKIDGTYNFSVDGSAVSDSTVKLNTLNDGDVIEFLMDTYDSDNNYLGTYVRGDALTVSGDLEISYVTLENGTANACYRIKDIYGGAHWTEIMENN